MRTNALSGLVCPLHMCRLLLELLSYLGQQEVPCGGLQPRLEVLPRDLQQFCLLRYAPDSRRIMVAGAEHIIFTDKVARSDVAEDMRINPPLVVLAIEFALNALSFYRVLLDLVHVLRLNILGVDFLGDHELALLHDEYFASEVAFSGKHAILGNLQVLEVGGEAIEGGSRWPRLYE